MFMKRAKFLELPRDSRAAAPFILCIGMALGVLFTTIVLTSWDELLAESQRVIIVPSSIVR